MAGRSMTVCSHHIIEDLDYRRQIKDNTKREARFFGTATAQDLIKCESQSTHASRYFS